MKLKFLSLMAALSLLCIRFPASAAENTDAATELKELITQLQVKIKDGKKTEAALAEDLKAFDDLLAKHKNEKTDDVAQILFMKAMLYLEVFDNTEKGIAAI